MTFKIGSSSLSLFISESVLQLVQVQPLSGLVMVIVKMRRTMLVVALMVVTVVDLMLRLLSAQIVNVWEKI